MPAVLSSQLPSGTTRMPAVLPSQLTSGTTSMPAVLPSQLTSGTMSMPAVLSSQLSNQAFRTANLAIGQNQSSYCTPALNTTMQFAVSLFLFVEQNFTEIILYCTSQNLVVDKMIYTRLFSFTFKSFGFN